MRKFKKIEIVLLILFTLSTFIFFKKQLANLFVTDFQGAGYYFSRQFDLILSWVNTDNLKEIGASSLENKDGVLYKFFKKPKGRVYLKFLYGIPLKEINEKYKDLRNAEILTENVLIKELKGNDLRIGENLIDMSRLLSGQTSFNIYLKRPDLKSLDHSGIGIRRIEVSSLPEAGSFLPDFSLIIVMILVPLLLLRCFSASGFSDILSFLFSLISMLIFYILTHFYYDFILHLHIYILLAASLLYYLIFRQRRHDSSQLHILLFIILLVLSIYLRWSEIERVTFALPHPDVRHVSLDAGYRKQAENMHLFTSRGFFAAEDKQLHEPFYPFLVKIFFRIFGSSDFHVKYVAFFFSILAVFLTYLVGNAFFKNRKIALLSTGLIAVNSYLIEQASWGLRLEVEMCFLLLLFYLCYLKREVLKTWGWLALSACIGGLWLLTKTYNIILIIFVFGYSVFTKKAVFLKKSIFLILLILMAVSFLLPYKINFYKKTGNLFNDNNSYATDFANFEFEGQKGFPKTNVNLGEYYFKLHTPWQFIKYNIIGSVEAFYCLSAEAFNAINEANHLLKVFISQGARGLLRYPILSLKIAIVLIFSALAFLFCLAKRNLRLLILMIFFGVLPVLFLYGVDVVKQVIVMHPYRTISHVMPLVFFCVAYAVYELYLILTNFKLRKISLLFERKNRSSR